MSGPSPFHFKIRKMRKVSGNVRTWIQVTWLQNPIVFSVRYCHSDNLVLLNLLKVCLQKFIRDLDGFCKPCERARKIRNTCWRPCCLSLLHPLSAFFRTFLSKEGGRHDQNQGHCLHQGKQCPWRPKTVAFGIWMISILRAALSFFSSLLNNLKNFLLWTNL